MGCVDEKLALIYVLDRIVLYFCQNFLHVYSRPIFGDLFSSFQYFLVCLSPEHVIRCMNLCVEEFQITLYTFNTVVSASTS